MKKGLVVVKENEGLTHFRIDALQNFVVFVRHKR